MPTSPLKARLLARARASLTPIAVHLDLTWLCNEKCIHCYVNQKSGGELDTAEIRDLLDQLADCGALFLTISGGEIMLRRDVFEIVAHARSRSFDVKLKTNATLIGDAEAAQLSRIGPRTIDVSFYSHRPEVHDAITKLPGSLERSIAGVRRLRECGLRADMVAIMMRDNLEDAEGLRNLARELGANIRFSAGLRPRMDGDESPLSIRLTVEDARRIHRNVTDESESVGKAHDSDEPLLDRHLCGAGRNFCYISPTGDVLPCPLFPLTCGNVRVSRFREIWQGSPQLAAVRQVRNRDLPVCRTCPNLASCARCPGTALMNGDMLGPSPLDCQDAYARTGIPTPLLPATQINPALSE